MLTHPGLAAIGLELLVGLDAERDLAAGREQQYIRLAIGSIGQDIGPLLDAGRRGYTGSGLG